MISQSGSVPPNGPRLPFLRYVPAAILAGLLAAGAFGASPDSGGPGPQLALVDKEPAPGRARLRLEESVGGIRFDYGPSLLVILAPGQEERLRDAGYAVRLFDNPDRIGLGFYSFRVPPGPAGLPPELVSDESRLETGTYLVKLIGPAGDAWLERIRSIPAEILTPIPAFTYLVRTAPNRAAALRGLPYVEWVGPYQPAFKLAPDLARRHQKGDLGAEVLDLNVLIYRSADVEATVNRIRALGGEVGDETASDFYEAARVTIAGGRVVDVARLPGVYAVETTPIPRLEDESSTQILAGQIDAFGVPFRPALAEPSYTDWLAARTLDGSNVSIGYVDNGVLNVDPSGHLSGRVNETACGSAGAAGHGHFGAATAGGACSHAPEAGTGYRWGLGVAPSVNFINLPALLSGTTCFAGIPIPGGPEGLARTTVINNGPNGAPGTIQNNSWGSGGYSADGNFIEDVRYTSLERTYDILTRDADSMAAGNQPLITCFSAGNEGNTTPGSNGDSPASLTSPHAAKNILTTGSSSVYRPGSGGTNINDRSLFSSQGPTFDGRIKPDFMTPGGAPGNVVALASATVASFGSPVGDGLHSLSAGTSFASPQTAGGAALLVQWWQRFASAVPSPAMTKALLINSAVDLAGANTPEFIPNRREGWGRWNLGNVIEPGTPTMVVAAPLFRKTSGVGAMYVDQGVLFGANGDTYQLRFIPSDITRPLKATLVWTDAPGAINSCPSLVNNLDLEILRNGKLLLRGNAFTNGTTAYGGPADPTNNVEEVIEPSPGGFYTLTVRATTLSGDGVPGNGDPTDQDFALVVSNAVQYSGPILAPAAFTPADTCAGTGSGGNSVLDPGEVVTLSVPLTNSGNVAATGVTGTLVSPPAGVSIVDGTSGYPNIAIGGTGNPNAGDTLQVALSGSIPCGTVLNLTYNVTTAQGAFALTLPLEVGAKTITPQDLNGTNGAVNDNIASPSTFTTPAAGAGTVRSVAVDLNLSSNDESFLFDDYNVELLSPLGTTVGLHSGPMPCESVVTSLPGSRLAQIGSLDSYKGENASGVWSLRVTDRNNIQVQGGGPPRPGSQGTVNSWTLHLSRESAPACNTCVVSTPPPEVSAPGSPTPLTMTYDGTTGQCTYAWQNLGGQADSYRLYSGLLSSLAGNGVTTSNTAPLQCGLLAAGTTLVPPAGDRFFLVAAQKGALIGPLGQATNPVLYPRNASQTCP